MQSKSLLLHQLVHRHLQAQASQGCHPLLRDHRRHILVGQCQGIQHQEGSLHQLCMTITGQQQQHTGPKCVETAAMADASRHNTQADISQPGGSLWEEFYGKLL